jgi:hypothetical protein
MESQAVRTPTCPGTRANSSGRKARSNSRKSGQSGLACKRELALFDLGIHSKLCACDSVKLRAACQLHALYGNLLPPGATGRVGASRGRVGLTFAGHTDASEN